LSLVIAIAAQCCGVQEILVLNFGSEITFPPVFFLAIQHPNNKKKKTIPL
jgi:hypothetical protein